ncbi:hypothetical protein STEG23_011814 [Scotinomys teguina]
MGCRGAPGICAFQRLMGARSVGKEVTVVVNHWITKGQRHKHDVHSHTSGNEKDDMVQADSPLSCQMKILYSADLKDCANPLKRESDSKRYLLTDSIVKLKEFQQKKVAIAYNLPSTKVIYFRNLEEKLTQNKLILKEELKTLLHLCQSREDVELAKSVIYRYHAENRNFTVGEYKFGPVFMRLCYELDLEDSAVELVKDKHLRGFFLDSTSFNILMDMLFTKGKYESALEVLIEMKNQDVKFSKDTYILAFAVCYKLNSPESFKICTTLREEALLKGDVVSRRASCFAVALALNQKSHNERNAFVAIAICSYVCACKECSYVELKTQHAFLFRDFGMQPLLCCYQRDTLPPTGGTERKGALRMLTWSAGGTERKGALRMLTWSAGGTERKGALRMLTWSAGGTERKGALRMLTWSAGGTERKGALRMLT